MLRYINLTRINRPIGIYLLALPCLIGVFFAKNVAFRYNFDEILRICLIFLAGSVIMRSAGCVINDIFDRKFDVLVARTKNRPLANGDLNLTQALILLAALLFLGLIILLQLSFKTIIGGLLALILVFLYPLMKRLTFYPQLFLGVVFNFGILLASLEISGSINFATWLLYFALILWTLIYDTIYGFQDIEDDLKIGVKSSAIAFAKNPRKFLSILAILMGFLLILAGFLQEKTVFYHFFAILAAAMEFVIIKNCDYKNPQKCLKMFKNNVFVGVLILCASFC